MVVAASGFGNVIVGIAHLIAVTVRATSAGDSFVYDFRVYSLWMLGVLITIPGLVCLRLARPLARGAAPAWSAAFWSCLFALGVTVPLIPLQKFAWLPVAFSVVGVAALLAGRRGFHAHA